VLDNDSDPVENDPISVAGIVGCADVTAPFDCATVNGGTVSMSANGRFTYISKPGDTAASDSFQYKLSDGTLTVNGTATITFKGRVWFVQNNSAAGGLGRSTDPFDTLPEAETASLAGDTIYVHEGNGTTTGQSTGIALKANQRLIGAGVTLDLPVSVNGGSNPTVLRAAASAPLIDNTTAGGNAVSATNAGGVEIRGLNLGGVANAIDVTTNTATSGTVIIKNNTIRAAGQEGIDVNLLAGTTGTLVMDVQSNAITSTGNGFDVLTLAGALQLNFSNNGGILANGAGVQIDGSASRLVTITGFANDMILGNAAGGTGINVTNAIFDSAPATAGFQTVSGGTITIGSSVNGVGTSGLVLGSVSGDLGFTDVDIYARNGAALNLTGTGAFTGSAGMRLTTGVGVSTFEATNGPAASVSSATIDLQLSSLKSTNSTTTGVSLTSVSDGTTAATFSAGAGSISGSTGTAFSVDGGNATISYAGTITNSAGRSVSVINRTADTATFSGAITATGGTGIFLNNNTGSTNTFTGAISLSTGGSDAFTATGGGTVTSNNAASTLTTTGGVALNVANTTIGAAGLKFQTINAGTAGTGPSSGIVLNSTGASGSLTVNGGTIQKTSSHGVSLTSTLSPSFSAVTIKNTAGSGVNGTQVTNFSFVNGAIDNVGTALGAETSNIAFNTTAAGTENNLSGTVTITGNTLTNAYYHGVDIFNFNGTIVDATISGNTITSTSSTATSKGSGIRLVAFGSATTVANVTKATIANNVISNFPSANGILASGGNGNAAGPSGIFGVAGNASNIIAITGNRVAGFSPAVRIGAFGIAATVNGKGQGNFDISGNGTAANPLTNMIGAAITTSSLGQAVVTSNIANNVIVANNQAGAQGIGAGTSQTFGATDTPSLTVIITGNNVSQTDGNGILVTARDATGTVRAKIQGNTVAAPLGGNRNGIRVDAGNAVSINDSVCLNISGNTSAGVGLSPEGIGLRKQGTVAGTNNFALHGLATSPASQAQAAAYTTSQNPGSASGTLIISGDNFNAPTCSFP
jgi:hypothetical protein